MNPTVSETSTRGTLSGCRARTVVSSVANSLSATNTSLPVSARRAGDIAQLHEAIVAHFRQNLVEAEIFLPWSAQKLRGEIFATCEVLEERAEGEGVLLRVRGEPEAVQRLRAQAQR